MSYSSRAMREMICYNISNKWKWKFLYDHFYNSCSVKRSFMSPILSVYFEEVGFNVIQRCFIIQLGEKVLPTIG